MGTPSSKAITRSWLVLPFLILVVLLAGGAFAWFEIGSGRGGRVGYELSAVSTLQHLQEIQEYFRNNDADGNGIQDYWRQDIAGLYTLPDKRGPLKLIEPSLAGADYQPKSDLSAYESRAPKAHYWYRVLRFPDEKSPDPKRFAICAFPDVATERARKTFIIAQDNVIYFKVLEKPETLAEYPADPGKEGWSRR
jgi:hypothetical protein